jgi:tRNA threonylcarbamoyladenosine biosynthesis protein TsaE
MKQAQSEVWQGRCTGVEQTMALGKAVAKTARGGDLVALIGELGSGKTQFVKGIATGLGLDPAVICSPTYVLVHEHELEQTSEARSADDALAVLMHIDAYRLDTAGDLASIGWDAEFSNAASDVRQNLLVVVEWADRLAQVPGAIGPDRLEVHLSHGSESMRLIECHCFGYWCDRMPRLYEAFDQLTASPANTEAYACPTCAKLIDAQAGTFPFCSKRCRQADLNRWLRGEYKISRPIEESDLDEY